jgi:predicted Zn-dependent protease
MPRFFQRLQASDYSSSNLPEFLRTHPVTNDRIAEALDRAEKYSQPPLKDTPHYHLMKAKLLVLITDNKQQLLKQLQTMLMQGRYRDERATRYAIALTLLAIKQVAGVQQQVEWLLQRDGDRVVYHILKAQLAWLQKQTTQTLALYEKALQIYPKDFMLSLNFAQTLLQTQAAAKAKSVLLALSPPPNSVYYQLLAQAYQQTGAKAEAHLALAEQFYLQGQMQQALEQLKLARKVKPLDFYLASRIEARYNELQQMWQEEQEQMQEEFKAKF